MERATRIMVFDRLDRYLFDLDMSERSLDVHYANVINGEHSITVTTRQPLSKTNRLLVRDEMGVWHEYVVLGIDETHTVNEYYCIWSVQYDLACTFVNDQYGCGVVPGHESVPQTPRKALECAMAGTSRWEIGTITVTTMAAASFYRRSGWEAMQTVIEKWGGELQATITVGSEGVESRAVDLLAHVGSDTATRRFDYGHDLASIKRTTSDDVWPCRIIPLGKAQETENGGYSRRPDISSVNSGRMWLQDDDVVDLVKVLNPSGEYEYPEVIVINDTYEDPSDLKAWAVAHKTEFTRPKVTYEADVVQFERAGMNAHGVALGDNVVAVDREFCDGGLRIMARVMKDEGSLLDKADTKLTIGNMTDSLASSLIGMSRQVSDLAEVVSQSHQFQATAEYMSHLMQRLNGQINANGGYFYITEGEGAATYDTPVSDPLVGEEASKVVEIRGGNIRIANSRTAAGDWDWKTLIQSGHVAANLVTAVNVVAGFIGNAGGTYWDLDNGILQIGATATLGGRSVTNVLSAVDATISDVDVEYAQNQSPTVPPAESSSDWGTTAPAWQAGRYIWSRTTTTSPNGVTHSTPVMISGRDGIDGQDGADGTSVTILGSYNTLAELQAAHPTGSSGDSYIVSGDLYVWNGTAWENMGQIQGPPGADGADGANGTSVTITSIQYGTSNSASTEPTSWDTTPPTSIAKGKWLWVKTNYNVGSPAITKSYVGTNGTNGTSVAIQSATKSGDTTTVVLVDGSGTQTLTIVDGEDGATGTPGLNGKNIHTAWANSADGSSGFSTTVSAGKKYLGTYADRSDNDSQDPTDYNWSLIKGADGQNGQDGQDGADGIGITKIEEQYYKSTSSSTQTGGSWSTDQPVWESGKYIWTRSKITWDTNPVTYTYTEPVLAKAINGANQAAKDVQDTLANYMRFSPSTGLEVGYMSDKSKVVIEGNGVQLYGEYNNDPIKVAKFAYIDRGYPTVYGKGPSLVMGDPDDYDYGPYCIACGGSAKNAFSISVGEDAYTESINSQAFGEGVQALDDWAAAFGYLSKSSGLASFASGNQTEATGDYSHAEGKTSTASGESSHAEGDETTASARGSHAEGVYTTASGACSHAEGATTTASGNYSHASGRGTKATKTGQFSCGQFNADSVNDAIFEVGCGSSNGSRASCFVVSPNAVRMFSSSSYGTVYVNGSSVHSSDRRLKDHDSYINPRDAAEFMRRLRPAIYDLKADGSTHMGFYAQDVRDAEKWGTETVVKGDDGMLSIDYTALIAPLVSYCQHLEERIVSLEKGR